MGFDIIEKIMLDNPEYYNKDKMGFLNGEIYDAYIKDLPINELLTIGLYIEMSVKIAELQKHYADEKLEPYYFKPYYALSGAYE